MAIIRVRRTGDALDLGLWWGRGGREGSNVPISLTSVLGIIFEHMREFFIFPSLLKLFAKIKSSLP
jgi:hypothetical protein